MSFPRKYIVIFSININAFHFNNPSNAKRVVTKITTWLVPPGNGRLDSEIQDYNSYGGSGVQVF